MKISVTSRRRDLTTVISSDGAHPLPPSFHIIGVRDQIRDESRELAMSFPERATYVIPFAGHSLPAGVQEECGHTPNETRRLTTLPCGIHDVLKL